MNEELERYIRNLSSPEDPLLTELDSESNLRVVQHKMVSGHVQGKFLTMLTEMIRPRRVLEIGTFTGYATLCFAAGMPDTSLCCTTRRLLSESSSASRGSSGDERLRMYLSSS